MGNYTRWTALFIAISVASMALAGDEAPQPDPQKKPARPGGKQGGKRPPASPKRQKAPDQGAKPSEPLTGIGLHGTLGSYRSYSRRSTDSFYSISYRGATLFSQGDPYSSAKVSEQDPIDFGDQPIYMQIDSGKSSVGGTLVDNLNAVRIPTRNVGVSNALRVLLGYSAQTQNEPQQNLLVGLEYRPNLTGNPSSPVAVANGSSPPEERFLGIGFATERHITSFTPEGMSGPISETIPTAEFRGRIGVGFNLVASRRRAADAKKNTAIALAQIEQQADSLQRAAAGVISKGAEKQDANAFDITKDNVRALADRFGINPPVGPSPMGGGGPARESMASLANALDSYSPPQPKGPETIAQEALRVAQAARDKLGLLQRVRTVGQAFLALDDEQTRKSIFKNQPRVSAFLEFDGSYALKNSDFLPRYRNIWSANLRIDLDPVNQNLGYILIHYENGFTRAEPNRRCSALVATLGWSF